MKKHYNKALLALIAVGSFAITPAANAIVTYDVQQGNNPPITLTADQQVLLHIPSMQNGVVLTFPELGTQPLTPTQQDTFFIDASTFQTRELRYVFTVPGGQSTASGTIINTNVGTTVSTTSLKSITKYSTAYSAAKDPEPQYGTPVAQAEEVDSEPQYTRGYW